MTDAFSEHETDSLPVNGPVHEIEPTRHLDPGPGGVPVDEIEPVDRPVPLGPAIAPRTAQRSIATRRTLAPRTAPRRATPQTVHRPPAHEQFKHTANDTISSSSSSMDNRDDADDYVIDLDSYGSPSLSSDSSLRSTRGTTALSSRSRATLTINSSQKRKSPPSLSGAVQDGGRESPGSCKMRKRWEDGLHKKTDEQVRSLKCCKHLKCFQICNLTYLKEKIELLSQLSYAKRRLTLQSMLCSDGRFHYDGHVVCGTFLYKAFHFSRDLQASIKHKESSIQRPLKNTASSSDGAADGDGIYRARASQEDPSVESYIPSTKGCEAVVSFLERIADECGEKVPDVDEQHLPFFRKTNVYDIFCQEFHLLEERFRLPSKAYFLRTWKKFCPSVKVRKYRRFSKCTICEEIDSAIKSAIVSHADTTEFKKRKAAHLNAIRRERIEYKKKRDRSILHPDQYLSMIIDGADQSAFGLPHLTVVTKDDRGQALKVRLVGVLHHGRPNKLRLFTLTAEHQTGANHIVETIHRFLNELAQKGPLAKTLYLQLDNCIRENKNRFLFAYLESLVHWGVFDDVIVGFLPVGHTHEDIDQSFSRTAERLRTNDAVTLSDLHHQLSQTYNEHTQVTDMKHTINWSGLCEEQGCLNPINSFSQYRYFHLSKRTVEQHESRLSRASSTTSPSLRTTCHVRVAVTDEWKPISVDHHGLATGFLRFAPDITATPVTVIKCPDGMNEVTKRIHSVESRINNAAKITSLYQLRDHVFRSRREVLHWDTSCCIELNSGILRHDEDEDVSLQPAVCSTPPTLPFNGVTANGTTESRYSYELNTFVAVRTSECTLEANTGGRSADHFSATPVHFWLGKIEVVTKSCDDVVTSLKVRWYETKNTQDFLNGQYFPSYYRSTKNKPIAWVNDVSPDSVIVNFSNLTKKQLIPANVKSKLRQEMSCYEAA